MRRLTFVGTLVLGLLAAWPVQAGYDESQTWFVGLPPEQRMQIQSDLILIGHYAYLVDAAFGQGTYSGLTSFQRLQGRPITGVLSAAELKKLADNAAAIRERLGIDTVTDEAAQLSIAVPTDLLTETASSDEGTTYSTPDDGVRLQTIRRSLADTGFEDFYREIGADAVRRTTSYSNFNNDRFVVTGTDNGRRFYAMFRNTGTEAVGYILSWSSAYNRDAEVIAVYLASNALPLNSLPATVEDTKSTSATAMRRFGAFALPDASPEVIMLTDEISTTTADEFWRALEARPDARTMVLNSPGGYVDVALVIAHEVRRRGMTTVVPTGSGCYSACAYIYFAGLPRQVEGELGVHQIYTEVADLVFAQTTLSDILDALDGFGVQQIIISRMLRTPPEDMYVFSEFEIREWGINEGGPVQIADISIGEETIVVPPPATEPAGGVAFVHLAQFSNEAEAERSMNNAKFRWASVLDGAAPEVARETASGGKLLFKVRVPARSVESANAMCSAIKSSGGGCYVVTR